MKRPCEGADNIAVDLCDPAVRSLAPPQASAVPHHPEHERWVCQTGEETLRAAEELRRPIELADARLEDYDAVYYPGGHGPMEDLWQDADSGRLLTAALASGKPLAIVCHAPVAMMASRRDGVSPFAGYRVTAFTNDEEDAVGLRAKSRWTAEDELVKLGAEFTRGEMWKPYTVVDRNLFTGQNPASAGPLAREFLKKLN